MHSRVVCPFQDHELSHAREPGWHAFWLPNSNSYVNRSVFWGLNLENHYRWFIQVFILCYFSSYFGVQRTRDFHNEVILFYGSNVIFSLLFPLRDFLFILKFHQYWFESLIWIIDLCRVNFADNSCFVILLQTFQPNISAHGLEVPSYLA